jgi:urease beta subunit
MDRLTIFTAAELARRLVFDRVQTWGMHLDIPAGDAVRWLPGEVKRVRLVAYGSVVLCGDSTT